MSLRSEGNMALFLLCVHKHLAILDSLGLGNQARIGSPVSLVNFDGDEYDDAVKFMMNIIVWNRRLEIVSVSSLPFINGAANYGH